MITVDMLEAKKVVFLKPIFEDDFVERGMKAWLTAVEWDPKTTCYQLYFDFTDFEAENEKYFRRTYYPNRHTSMIDTQRQMFTAIEAGQYERKYSVYFSNMRDGVCLDVEDAEAFAESIKEYLKEVE